MSQQILLPFNYKVIGHEYFLVNFLGKYSLVSEQVFNDLIEGKSKSDELRGVFFIDDNDNIDGLIAQYRKKKQYLNNGPSLFIFVLTNRCDNNCVYCQASRSLSVTKGSDMDLALAKQAIDLLFSFAKQNIVIEFQGGEPLLNFETLKYIVNYSTKYGNRVKFVLVTNLLSLDNAQLSFLVNNNVSLCTSLDGNEAIHNLNRPHSKKVNGYKLLSDKIELLRSQNVKIEAIQTTTKNSLRFPKQIIDQYVDFGFDTIFIRPLNPFGFAEKNSTITYSPYEFLEFYTKSLDYIIDLNRQGVFIKERTASIFLTKIFTDSDINYMDLRSPCGATIGQMAFNHDGKIYTCDEGRMMGESGDDSFLLGRVGDTSFRQLFDNNITKLICLASCAETSPMCNQCVYLPYCGICPVINYARGINLFKNDPYRCIIYKGILDKLFSFILYDENVLPILKSWIA